MSALDSRPMSSDEVADLVQRARRPYTCSRCGETGHNVQTCGREPAPAYRPRSTGGRSGEAARYVHEHGGTCADAARRFGVSHQAVEQAWSRLFPGNPVPTVLETGWKRLQAVSLAFDGKTVAEIADATGFSTHSVYYHLRQLGVAFEPGASTATDQASIDAAIADVEAGASMVDAAIDNGVGREPLRKAMRERGVESSVRGGARHGGLARALTLIEQGASAPEAARAARVATSSIYAKRAKLIRQRAEARP